MSLSLRDELRVFLSRDQVQLVRIARSLTLQGKSSHVADKKSLPCVMEESSSWGSALKTLEKALAGLPSKPAFAQVVLSNSLVRYAMIPPSPSLGNELEEIAYAKHVFSQLYGTSAESMEIRLQQSLINEPQLSSAVDGDLLHALRALFVSANIRLKSVQPQLMLAYNNCHANFQKQNAWFALFEQGSLCLGLVQQGHWRSIRTIKVSRDWFDRLPEILDREIYLSEVDVSTDDIFLWSPEHWRVTLPKSTRWKIHKLQPVVHADFVPGYDERFALAMCG